MAGCKAQALATGRAVGPPGPRLRADRHERDIFPLPVPPVTEKPEQRFSRRSQQRISRKCRRSEEVAETVCCLNYLHGIPFDSSNHFCLPDGMQSEVLERVDRRVVQARILEADHVHYGGEAALRELLQGRGEYQIAGNNSLASFKSSLVSLPDSLEGCPSILRQLAGAEAQYLKCPERMLRSLEELRDFLEASEPYMDPIWRFNRRAYLSFVRRLHKLGF